MRMHRWIPVFTLAAALSLGACAGEGGGEAKLDSADGTGGASSASGSGSPVNGQSGGSPSGQEQATAVNDTAPHRPGANPSLGNQP